MDADVADAGAAGEDGWEVSTELPEVAGNDGGRQAPGEGSEEDATGQDEELADRGAPGSGDDAAAGSENRQQGEQEGGGAGQQGDDLARALEDLDGEILDERMAARRSGRADASQGRQTAAAGGGQSGRGAMPGRPTVAPAVPNAPKPPLPQARDAPDARDDCVVARQLREAAMNEADPELREALWKEYERYKSCS